MGGLCPPEKNPAHNQPCIFSDKGFDFEWGLACLLISSLIGSGDMDWLAADRFFGCVVSMGSAVVMLSVTIGGSTIGKIDTVPFATWLIKVHVQMKLVGATRRQGAWGRKQISDLGRLVCGSSKSCWSLYSDMLCLQCLPQTGNSRSQWHLGCRAHCTGFYWRKIHLLVLGNHLKPQNIHLQWVTSLHGKCKEGTCLHSWLSTPGFMESHLLPTAVDRCSFHHKKFSKISHGFLFICAKFAQPCHQHVGSYCSLS